MWCYVVLEERSEDGRALPTGRGRSPGYSTLTNEKVQGVKPWPMSCPINERVRVYAEERQQAIADEVRRIVAPRSPISPAVLRHQ